MFVRQIDWNDFFGALMVYALATLLTLAIIFNNNQNILNLCLVAMMFLMATLSFFWQKLKWGVEASFLLIAFLLAMVFTPFYCAYKYLRQKVP